MTQTNLTLVQFIRSLPITDIATALQALVIYDTRGGNFDDFIYTLMPLINYSVMSPLMVILNMTRLNDGSKNVARFVADSSTYIPTQISIPSLFCETYNDLRLFEEFVLYVHEHSVESQYLISLITSSIEREPATIEFFSRVLNNFAFRFSQARFYDCLSFLNDFYIVLSVKAIRHSFCESPYFFQVMLCLFQKTVLPSDNRLEFIEFFGEDPPRTINNNKMTTLESLLSSYHQKLSSIIRLCLLSETKYKAYDFIRGFLFQIKANVQNEKFLMVSYNFESALMYLAFMTQSKWATVNPFTPYMRNSLAPLGDEPELAVPGKDSWVDENNTSNASNFQNLLEETDDPTEIAKENKEWNNIITEQNYQGNEPDPVSQFFFATLQAIDLVSSNFVEVLSNLARAVYYSINPAINEANEFNRPALIAKKKAIDHLTFALTTLLLIKSKSDKMLEFFEATLSFLQRTANYNEMSKTLPNRPPLFYQRLPEYILASVAKLVLYFQRQRVIREPFRFIIKFSSLFSNSKFVRNPTIGDNIVHFLAEIASEPVGGNCHLVVADTVIELAYPAVVKFFSRVQVTGTHSEYYDRMNMRTPCIELLTFWMRHQECRRYFLNHYETDANTTFLFYLIEDTSSYFSSCLNSFIQIEQTKKSKGEPDEISSNIKTIRQELKADFLKVKKWMTLIISIAEFAPIAFKSGKLAKKYPAFILSSLERASTPNLLSIENADELEYDPHYFLTTFASLATLAMTNKDVFVNFSKLEAGYSEELMTKIMRALNSLPRIQENESLCVRFAQFMNMAKEMASTDLLVGIDQDLAPPEFLDPILMGLMMDPVILPTGTIIDRTTLEMSIMDGVIDPVKMVPFKMEEMKPHTELKEKIMEWIKSQKEQK